MIPSRLERLAVAVLSSLVTLWLGIKETSGAMPLAFRVKLVLLGALSMAGVVWWMSRSGPCDERSALSSKPSSGVAAAIASILPPGGWTTPRIARTRPVMARLPTPGLEVRPCR